MSQRRTTSTLTATVTERSSSGTSARVLNPRHEELLTLLHQWQSESDGYDQAIWPWVEDELKNVGTRCRE